MDGVRVECPFRYKRQPHGAAAAYERRPTVVRGAGRALFAAVLLVIAGTLNMIYGIAAISGAHFYDQTTRYLFFSLKGWGWITLILGVIQLTAGFSLFGGGTYGRLVGVAAASLGGVG